MDSDCTPSFFSPTTKAFLLGFGCSNSLLKQPASELSDNIGRLGCEVAIGHVLDRIFSDSDDGETCQEEQCPMEAAHDLAKLLLKTLTGEHDLKVDTAELALSFAYGYAQRVGRSAAESTTTDLSKGWQLAAKALDVAADHPDFVRASRLWPFSRHFSLTETKTDVADGSRHEDAAATAIRQAPACYLNAASRSPLPKTSQQAAIHAVHEKTLPWQMADGSDVVQRVRTLYAKLLGVASSSPEFHTDPSCIALMPSTSYAMSWVAAQIKMDPGDKFLVLAGQMASNVMPWQDLCERSHASLLVVERPSSLFCSASASGTASAWTTAIQTALETHKPKYAALPQVHWTDGSWIDLNTISAVCHQKNTGLILDLTQTAGLVPANVSQWQPMAVASSAHKTLMGLYGSCLVYVHPALWNRWRPHEQHERSRRGADNSRWDVWGSMRCSISTTTVSDRDAASTASIGYPTAFEGGARKFDAGGRPNPVLLPALAESLCLLDQWTEPCKRLWLQPLTDIVHHCASQLGYLVPFGHGWHMLGLYLEKDLERLDGMSHEDFYEQLHSSQPLMAELVGSLLKDHDVHVSVRSGAIRVSAHMYADVAMVSRFCSVLRSVSRACGIGDAADQ